MTSEERAAIEWLEGLPEGERLYHFRAPVGDRAGLFSLKRDHERSPSGKCYRCKGAEQRGTLVVIE